MILVTPTKMATDSREFRVVREKFADICNCISVPDIANFANELLQRGLISYAGHQQAIAITGVSPTNKIAHLFSEAANKVSNSPDKFYKFLSILESRNTELASALRSDYSAAPVTQPIATRREESIRDIQSQIRAKMLKHTALQNELQQERQLLKKHEADIIANKDFTYSYTAMKQRKVDLPVGVYTTNCLNCYRTCHENCPYANDEDKRNCSVMDNPGSQDATCTVCPKKCSWRYHVNNPYKFEFYEETETHTSHDLKSRYESANTNKREVEAVINKFEEESKILNRAALQNIKDARKRYQHQQRLALEPPDHLTVSKFIDMLITFEQQEAHPGWSECVRALKEIQSIASDDPGKNNTYANTPEFELDFHTYQSNQTLYFD